MLRRNFLNHRVLLRALCLWVLAHGAVDLSVHAMRVLRALAFLVWNVPPKFLALQCCHMVQAAMWVTARRITGRKRSHRWNILMEVFVEATRPCNACLQNFDQCITPLCQTLTLLDCYVPQVVRFVHPRVKMESVTQGCPRPMTWVWLDDKTTVGKELVILFLHGGGHFMFTGRSHLELIARMVKTYASFKLPVRACVVDTRRAPEHPWPAPLDDGIASYDWLQNVGYTADQIVIAGDSAGGGLCLSLLQALRDTQRPMPLCSMVVSPMTDFTAGEKQHEKRERNTALQKDFLPANSSSICAKYYCAGVDPKHHLVSAKYGELHSLPPVLIQAGESETLARDSVEFAQRMEAYGSTVQLEMYPDMPHVFVMFALLGLEDAQLAVERQAKFLKAVVTGGFENRARRRLQVLVHDKRTRSFEHLPDIASSPSSNGRAHAMVSIASSPMLPLSSNKHNSSSFAEQMKSRAKKEALSAREPRSEGRSP